MKYLYLIQILSVRIFPILNPIWAWRFIEIRMSTTAPISDRDEVLPPDLDVRWDLDIEFDADGNGNPADDWVTPTPATESRVTGVWEEVGNLHAAN